MIALFDSGYGGLTVLKPIIEALPQYDYLYLGDNARAPYGGHSPERITEFSKQAVDFLFAKGAKLIIFACNTASSASLRIIQNEYLNGKDEKEKKVLGVLIPAVEKAAEISRKRRIGVVGTKATIQSRVYEKELQKIDPEIKVFSQACPLLVPFIEEGWQNRPEAISILKKYLLPLKSKQIDTLILGCTHYPLMAKHFKRIMGAKTTLISSGDATAEKLVDYLAKHPEIESKLSRGATREFLTTDSASDFKLYVEKHLGMKIKTPEAVQLG
jgi:glutamate racemase